MSAALAAALAMRSTLSYLLIVREVLGRQSRLLLRVHLGDRLEPRKVEASARLAVIGYRVEFRFLVVAKARSLEGEAPQDPIPLGVPAQAAPALPHAAAQVEAWIRPPRRRRRGGLGRRLAVAMDLLPLVVVLAVVADVDRVVGEAYNRIQTQDHRVCWARQRARQERRYYCVRTTTPPPPPFDENDRRSRHFGG